MALQSASGPCRLSAKLVPTFADREGATWSAQWIPMVVTSISYTGAATISWVSEPSSRPTAAQKIWQRRESNPVPLYLWPEGLTTRPQGRSEIKPSSMEIDLQPSIIQLSKQHCS
jgi:hypothetical protein